MCGDGLVEREHACNHRTVTALTDQIAQVFKIVGALFGSANNDPPTRTARQHHDLTHLRQSRLDANEAATGIQHLQATLDAPVASHIKNHVETLFQLSEVLAFVVDHADGTERTYLIEVSAAAHTSDLATHDAGQLNRGHADVARGSVDQNRLACNKTGPFEKGKRRTATKRKSGSVLERQMPGLVSDGASGGDAQVLGVSAHSETTDAENRIAWQEAFCVVPPSVDHAREYCPENRISGTSPAQRQPAQCTKAFRHVHAAYATVAGCDG